LFKNAPILKLIYLNILNPARANIRSSYKFKSGPSNKFKPSPNNKYKPKTPQTLKPKRFKGSKFPKNINKLPEKVGDFLK